MIMNLYLRSSSKIIKPLELLRGVTSKATTKVDTLTRELLLSVKDEKSEHRFRKAVQKLEDFDVHWAQNLKEHRTISSIANDLLKNKRYEEFDFLIDKMSIENCSLGMKTTTLKCYIERQLWNKAIPLFDELDEKVKHLRLYHDIVQGFSKDQNIDIAHRYLKKLLQKERETLYKRNAKSSQGTVESILKAVSLSATPHHQFEVVNTTLKYMQHGDYLANDETLSSLHFIFNAKNTSANYSVIENECLCKNCNTNLSHDNDLVHIHNDICQNIEKQLIRTGSHTHLQKINDSFSNDCYYDYIVDVANVLTSQAKNNQVNLQRLKNILSCIVQQTSYNGRVVLVLPRGGIVKSIDLSRYIRHLCQSFVMSCHIDIVAGRKLDEDLLVLYLGAKSAILAGKDCKINIISNDCFTEYTALVPEQQKEDMLRWLRYSVKGFSNEGEIYCKPYMSAVVTHKNRIHVKAENGKILCIEI